MVFINPNLPIDISGQIKAPMKPNIKVGESVATLGGGRNVGSQIAPNQSLKNASAISGMQKAQGTENTKAMQPQPTLREPLTLDHINHMLIQLEMPINNTSQNLVALMIEYGVPLTGERFQQISQLLQGKNKLISTESAVITYVKGLEAFPKAVDLLSNFLVYNSQISSQAAAMQQAMADFKGFITSNQAFANAGVMAGLANIIGKLEGELSKLLKKASGKSINLAQLKRAGLLTDLFTFSQFISGLMKKFGKNENAQQMALLKNLQNLKAKLSDLLGNLTAQSILSKLFKINPHAETDNYAYWQIPNPLGPKLADIEILIKKEKHHKKTKINLYNNRIFLKLETPDLGEITIIIDIKENRVWYTFNTSNEKTRRFIAAMHMDLKERMSSINYEIGGIKTVIKKINLKKYILPTINLDEVIRIKTEV
jgi:hypothetical protein